MTRSALALLATALSTGCFSEKENSEVGDVDDFSSDGSDGADGGADGGDGSDGGTDGDSAAPLDADGDGFPADEDCDDDDPTVYPGADEDCSDIDRDCDGDPVAGAIDVVEGWIDDDGDGYGDPARAVRACTLPSDAVDNDLDCDDGDPAINPAALEICDGETDEDCDGDIDADDTDIDACEAASWDGTYAGPFDLDVTVTTLGISDTCSGTGTAVVDSAASPAISTTVSCAFVGTLGSLLPGSQSGDVDGEFDTANTASGTLDLAGIVTDTWTGTFTSPDTFTASVTGSTTYGGYAITYAGTFTGTR